MFSRLTMNSLWLLLARIGTQAGMALFTIILARRFGSSVFGEYTFIASLIVIGNVLTTFGTDMFLIREIAATEKISDLFSALVVQILLSVIFIALIGVGSTHLQNLGPEGVLALRIYSFSLIPLAFFTVFTTILRGRQQMIHYASLNLVLIMLQLAALFWLRSQQGGIIYLAILLLMVQAIGTILAGYFCQFQIQYRPNPLSDLFRHLWDLISNCAPIALLGLLGILYQRLSSIIILSLSGTAQTGYFSAAARVVEAAKIGHIAVFTALYPLMAQIHTSAKSNWIRSFRLPVLLLLGGSVLASIILTFLAKPIISILFGSDYIASISPLQVLAWMLIPYTVNSFLSLAFLAEGNVTVIIVALLSTIITLVVFTIWWESHSNLDGAAWAALISEVLQSIILLYWYFQKHQNSFIIHFIKDYDSL